MKNRREIDRFFLAEWCERCGACRQGNANMIERRFKVALPPGCQDWPRCSGILETELRAEIAAAETT